MPAYKILFKTAAGTHKYTGILEDPNYKNPEDALKDTTDYVRANYIMISCAPLSSHYHIKAARERGRAKSKETPIF